MIRLAAATFAGVLFVVPLVTAPIPVVAEIGSLGLLLMKPVMPPGNSVAKPVPAT